MEKISNVQLIDVGGGQVVVGYYNADKDRFERIGQASQVFVCGLNGKDDSAYKLIVADRMLWLLWDGQLRFVGGIGEGLVMLHSGDHCLRKYDLTNTPLPFHSLFVLFDDPLPRKWVPVTEYGWDVNQVTAKEYFGGGHLRFDIAHNSLGQKLPAICICNVDK